ncbi:MAG: caspase family protein [Kofleriaceae bacterium]|nr:caspase family protein [Kofleriaceae bacterium]
MGDTKASNAPEAKGGTRRALLVGINDYPGFNSDLPSCVADVDAMGDLLSRHYGFELDILVDGDATQDAVRAGLARLCSNVSAADRICFFYSGHGTTVPRRDSIEECLVLADGSLLPDDDFVAAFTGVPAGCALVVLDSCFSGGMAKEFLLGAATEGKPKRITMLTPHANAGVSKTGNYRPFGSRPRPTIGGFAPFRKKALVEFDEAQDDLLNALLVSACLEGETASASTSATNGLSAFTYSLVSSIANHGAGTAITTTQLVVDATAELRRIGAIQTPQVKEPANPPKHADTSFPLLQLATGQSKVYTGPRGALAAPPPPRPPLGDPRIQLATAFLNALGNVRVP